MSRFGGTWSESKLNCLEEYAHAYLQVMQNQSWAALHYVDAFAGRGKQALKSSMGGSPELSELESFFGSEGDRAETKEFLEGSALRVLRASRSSSRSFDHFMLIDAHEPSGKELQSVVAAEHPEVLDRVDFRCEDANVALQEYVGSVDWHATRSLVFLDPFGLEVRWSTIERLASSEACDVWYLFPLGGVIRMMEGSGHIPDSWRRRLDELLGADDWFDEFYPATQTSLLGEQHDVALKNASTPHVVDYIRQRLLAAFPAVSEAAVLRNSRGSPLFALVLGVSNPSKPAQHAAIRIGNHLTRELSAQ